MDKSDLFSVIQNAYRKILPLTLTDLESIPNIKEQLHTPVNSDGDNILMELISDNYCKAFVLESIEVFSTLGLDLNYKNKYGETALIYAIKRKETQIIEELIIRKVDLNIKDRNGTPAIMLAMKLESYAREIIIDMFIKANADLNMRDSEGQTVLMKAAEIKSILSFEIELSSKLVKAGAEVNIEDYSGNTPLSIACCYGCMRIVENLIQLGADINYINAYNRTILMQVVYQSHRIWAVEYLLDKVDLQNKNNKKVLLMCYQGYFCEYIFKMLIKAGADLNVVDETGCSLLMIEIKRQKIERAKFLTKKNANLNAINHSAETAFTLARKEESTEILERLIKKRTHLNGKYAILI